MGGGVVCVDLAQADSINAKVRLATLISPP